MQSAEIVVVQPAPSDWLLALTGGGRDANTDSALVLCLVAPSSEYIASHACRKPNQAIHNLDM